MMSMKCAAPQMMADMDYCCAEPEMPMPAAEVKPKRRPGRIASLFKLNKAKYTEMKEEGNKMEF